METEFPYIKDYRPRITKSLGSFNAYEIAYNCYKNMIAKEKKELSFFAEQRKYEVGFLQDAEIFYVTGNKLLNSVNGDIERRNILVEGKLLKEKIVDYVDINSEKTYLQDTFYSDRVVLALRDYNDDLVGFAGRAIDTTPKYLFTQELPKSNFLYRLNIVKNKCKVNKNEVCELFITEGVFDALRLEYIGLYAVSVLGSHITKDQVKILGKFIKEMGSQNKEVVLHLFLDTDNAGIKGAFDSINNLWSYRLTRKTRIDVVINKEGLAGISQNYDSKHKDPDEILKEISAEECEKWIKVNTIDVFDFLLRYLYDNEALIYNRNGISLENAFDDMEPIEKLSIMARLKSMLPGKIWDDVIAYYKFFEDDKVAFRKFNSYLYGKKVEDEKDTFIPPSTEEELFIRAISIAKNSYTREEAVLDDFTWDRIQYCADVFIPYFQSVLKNEISEVKYNSEDKIPMLAISSPKKHNEFRLKMQYIHEQLILQQYVLNALLSSDKYNHEYEEFIPAVRYDRMNDKVCTTGVGYYDFYKDLGVENVSFAYQINMVSINGISTGEGMYRPFYECWCSFINYIRQGINSIEGDVVYKVRLDIKKYYEKITLYTVRNMLVTQLKQALVVSGDRFSGLLGLDAEKITDWIDSQAFGYQYYDSESGKITSSENGLYGIPQGPNLSSYLANIILFPMDKRITEYVSKVNDKFDEQNGENNKTIHVRYARYVDDMVIVSDSPEHLNAIKEIIVNELQKLDLELSPKTDDAEEISKQDAFNWLIDERGGLGVSSVYDLPDDSLEMILDKYDSYESINRRDAIKLLNNLVFDFEQIEDENLFYDIVESVFKSDEIRYNDIVRFSEMILRYIIRENEKKKESNIEFEKDLIKQYEKVWNDNIQNSPPNSMFQRNGLCFLSFIDGIIRLLKPDNRINRNIDEQKLKEKDRFVVISFIKEHDLFQELDNRIISNDDVLLLNRSVLKQKVLQIVDLSLKKLPEPDDMQILQTEDLLEDIFNMYEKRLKYILGNGNSNEYERRWVYSIFINLNALNIGKSLMSELKLLYQEKTLKEKSLLRFHFFTSRLIACRSIIDFNDSFDLFITSENINLSTIFDSCLSLWFDYPQEQEHSYEHKIIALKVLTNIVIKSIIASVLDNNSKLKKFLFSNPNVLQYLPVPPGINYNGIFALSIKDDVKMSALRADLDKDYGENFAKLQWENHNNKINSIKLYSTNIEEKKWISLNEYFRGKKPTPELVHNVSSKYKKLLDFINESKDNEKLVLSKHHIFLNNNDNIDVLSYESESETNVAISNGSNSLKTIYVKPDGNAYWKAGQVISDALSIGNVILKENDYSTLILLNSLKRLTGCYEYKSLNAIKKSVERTLLSLDNFPKDEAVQQIYVLDSYIINNFIEYRINNNFFIDEAMSYHLYRWSQQCLGKYYKDFISVFNKVGVDGTGYDIIKRRSSWSYFSIARNIGKILDNNSDLLGLKALRSGLLISSILENIRMQVLERIVSLKSNETIGLMQKGFTGNSTEIFPDSENKNIKYIINASNNDLRNIVNDLLSKRHVESIKYITLEGWLFILWWLLEIDTSSHYVTSLRINNHDESMLQEIRNIFVDLCEKFHLDSNDEKVTYMENVYPFDIVAKLLNFWNEDNSLDIFRILNKIDGFDGIVVETKSSKFFIKQLERASDVKYSKVMLNLDGLNINNMPVYFITEAHVGIANTITESDSTTGEKVWSQTKINNEIYGVSVISSVVSTLAKGSETESVKGSQNLNKNVSSDKEDSRVGKCQENQTTENTQAITDLIKDEVKQDNVENCGIDEDFSKIIKVISEFQRKSWEDRKRKFKTLDRIALFQFDVDDSYQHPVSELCLDQMESNTNESLCEKNIREIKKNPEKWNTVINKMDIHSLNSCAEFRRRKLLDKVFDACYSFDVDILILPEYSVRPETVAWMYSRIIDNGYKFSVWAGTFRIVPENNLAKEKDVFIDLFTSAINEMEMDPTCYWAAVLPVICNEQRNVPGAQKKDIFPRTIIKKFKKYPAVSLQEFINPSKTIKKHLEPVVKTFDRGTLFGDARDDVIELICSEMFIMMSPSNIESFAAASYNLYRNFAKSLPDYDNYLKEISNDIVEFGKRTAINNSVSKYYRTPIILVPAYTTRAIDYYVAGQAGYLSAGITTVFCNAVGPQTEGGSCFIGTDCWDNRDGNTTVSYIPDYSPYHGVIPGIYKQFYEYRDRGGLGREEQALLICDINPNISFCGKPNPQSLGKCLELVAHLPIIESYKSKRKEIEKNINKQSEKGCRCKIAVKRNNVKEKPDGAITGIKELYTYYFGNDSLTHSYVTTVQDTNPNKMRDALVSIGSAIQSEWLIRRGEAYLKQHINSPQGWPPPTALDWIWVDVDYINAYEVNKGEYNIDVPVFTKAEPDKITRTEV